VSAIRPVQGWAIYQPLIVGLGAVVLGLIANTLLEWFKQRLVRANETRALRVALIAELTANLQNMSDRMKAKNVIGKESEANMMMVPLGTHTQVYDASISKLGLLSSSEITSVIKAYDFMVNAPKNFAFLGKICGDNYHRWAEVSSRYEGTLALMDQNTSKLIESALADLSNPNQRKTPATNMATGAGCNA
jgi:hypothetical protein